MASAAREIRATNPAGTEIVGHVLHPDLQVAQNQKRNYQLRISGAICPAARRFTTPERVDGTFVIDGVVGDYLCEKYGDLGRHPADHPGGRQPPARSALRQQGVGNRVSGITATPTNTATASGEFAIGTNIGVRDVIGNILQDEKIPGIHIAFGNPYAAHTGADWYSATHIDVVGRQFDIWIDGQQIMHGGAFLFEIPSLRQPFNRDWTPQGYERFLALIERNCGVATQFRHSETLLLSAHPVALCAARYGREMVQQLLADPAYLHDFRQRRFPPATISQTKPKCRFSCKPTSAWMPAWSRSWWRFRPSLPLYAYQPVMAESYREAYECPAICPRCWMA